MLCRAARRVVHDSAELVRSIGLGAGWAQRVGFAADGRGDTAQAQYGMDCDGDGRRQ